ncbi:hypothetical protein K439DRAFT_557787 [Ramaria rubella]|nr:hypothetical protein K439DRAFT_557787 [Ramaria rubella]
MLVGCYLSPQSALRGLPSSVFGPSLKRFQFTWLWSCRHSVHFRLTSVFGISIMSQDCQTYTLQGDAHREGAGRWAGVDEVGKASLNRPCRCMHGGNGVVEGWQWSVNDVVVWRVGDKRQEREELGGQRGHVGDGGGGVCVGDKDGARARRGSAWVATGEAWRGRVARGSSDGAGLAGQRAGMDGVRWGGAWVARGGGGGRQGWRGGRKRGGTRQGWVP